MLPLALAVGIVAGSTAHATALNPAQIMNSLNGVILGDFTSNSDVEGPLAIEGNMTGGATFNNQPRTTPPPGLGALTVYGNVANHNYNINNGGSVWVGGTNSGHFNFNGGGAFLASNPYSTSDLNSVVGESALIAELTANSTIGGTMPNSVVFNTAPDAHGIAVFNLSATALESYSGFQINANGASAILINVDASGSGGAVNLGNHFNGQTTSLYQSVLWNFYNASSVHFGTQWGGAVLAPGADVSNGTQINGFLLAKDFTGGGELHNYGYTGSLPVPEPGTLALLVSGIVGLGLVRRRRRR